MKRIVALAGGVGAARFLEGLARVVPPEKIFIVVNTGDDACFHNLHIAPDLDTITYTLAGVADRRRGWGITGDSFRCLQGLGRLGAETWFQLGDRDLATHLYRTERLRQGSTLSQVTAEISLALGVRATIVPMTDSPVRTQVRTRRETLDFQTYFVRRRARDVVQGVSFRGARQARPAPGVIEAIREASGVVICPSNPILSIGPILAVPGIGEALRKTAAPVASISPLVAGRALKGPAARMMKSLGLVASALGVAKLYREFASVFVLDCADQGQARRIEALGLKAVVTNTIMSGWREKKALARIVLESLR